MYMYVCICIYIYIYIYVFDLYICVCIYIERERERDMCICIYPILAIILNYCCFRAEILHASGLDSIRILCSRGEIPRHALNTHAHAYCVLLHGRAGAQALHMSCTLRVHAACMSSSYSADAVRMPSHTSLAHTVNPHAKNPQTKIL